MYGAEGLMRGGYLMMVVRMVRTVPTVIPMVGPVVGLVLSLLQLDDSLEQEGHVCGIIMVVMMVG